MSEIIDRIQRIIKVKLWARKKKAEAISDKKENSNQTEKHIGGGIIGMFITLIIASVIVLQVVYPVVDQAINGINNQPLNSSSIEQPISTMLSLFPLMLLIGLAMAFIRPMM